MRKAILILGIIGTATIAAPAMADVPPPNSEGCMGKVAADACQKDDMSAGSCVAQTCSRLDYSMGTPPTTVEYQCLLCSGPAPTPDAPTDDDGACSVSRYAGMNTAGAIGAWIFGAAMLMFVRRNRSRRS